MFDEETQGGKLAGYGFEELGVVGQRAVGKAGDFLAVGTQHLDGTLLTQHQQGTFALLERSLQAIQAAGVAGRFAEKQVELLLDERQVAENFAGDLVHQQAFLGLARDFVELW